MSFYLSSKNILSALVNTPWVDRVEKRGFDARMKQLEYLLGNPPLTATYGVYANMMFFLLRSLFDEAITHPKNYDSNEQLEKIRGLICTIQERISNFPDLGKQEQSLVTRLSASIEKQAKLVDELIEPSLTCDTRQSLVMEHFNYVAKAF